MPTHETLLSLDSTAAPSVSDEVQARSSAVWSFVAPLLATVAVAVIGGMLVLVVFYAFFVAAPLLAAAIAWVLIRPPRGPADG